MACGETVGVVNLPGRAFLHEILSVINDGEIEHAVLAAPRTVRFTFFDDGRPWSVEVARTLRRRWRGPPYPARRRARWWRPGWLLIAVQ
ncbi:hypothetical protein C8245_24860 [Paracidovorax avenae]|nr:hypothetical protein C8245_24860 [Paracidovorax avenae]